MIDSDVFLAENAAELIREAQNFHQSEDNSPNGQSESKNLQIICLRPSKGLHGTVYHGKYFKTIEMFPPSQIPAYCNGQATFLTRSGKFYDYFI